MRDLIVKKFENPDKIICWEHPNFVSNIKFHLDDIFSLQKQNFFPIKIINGDFNLLFSFKLYILIF